MTWKRDFVIFKQEGSYSCFPGLEHLTDGRLVVSFIQRDWPSHNATGRIRALVSKDDAQTWSESLDPTLAALWPGATGKFRCTLADGTWLDMGAGGLDGHFDDPAVRPLAERAQWIAQGYHTSDHEQDPDLFYLAGRDLHIGLSRDRGKTWQRQTAAAPADLRNLSGFRGLRLRDNTLLFPVGGPPAGKAMGTAWRQYMARSTDQGQTWKWTLIVDDPHGFCTEEVTLLELDSGLVLALTRAHRPGPTGYLWQQWSADGGRSWSEPVETQIWGYPCHLLQLPDGRILCTYGYRFRPAGIRAVLSADGGRSWDMANARVLRDDGGTPAQGWGPDQLAKFKQRGVAGADLGYPHSTQLADGSILTVYYFTGTDGITHVAGSQWRLEGSL